ncbi:MAG: hypothetical protein ACD_51C00097G0006 [uncultured bacterium]|nr:MAG: hypothetical protein ACD_51C00097G0006 [uncultured bacterium]OGJ48075.1 MAG: hypothetical protein A2244_01135 [Candidatus Peregrinibacteria bacterium RIFOXYA2_FULL_41_18]
MLTQDIKHGFARLSRSKKVVLISAILTSFSCLLPWYHDLSVYGVADSYLGINGPLFLAGIFIFAMNAFLTLSIAMPMIGKRFVKLPLKGSVAGMLVGLQSLFLLLIANSVFYHAKFGISISQKTAGFGMAIAMFSVLALIGGSYFWYKEESVDRGFDEAVGRKEPLIKIPEVAPVRQHTNLTPKTPVEPPIAPQQQKNEPNKLRGFGFRDSGRGDTIESLLKKHQNLTGESQPSTVSETNIRSGEDRGKIENMRIRMDL